MMRLGSKSNPSKKLRSPGRRDLFRECILYIDREVPIYQLFPDTVVELGKKPLCETNSVPSPSWLIQQAYSVKVHPGRSYEKKHIIERMHSPTRQYPFIKANQPTTRARPVVVCIDANRLFFVRHRGHVCLKVTRPGCVAGNR